MSPLEEFLKKRRFWKLRLDSSPHRQTFRKPTLQALRITPEQTLTFDLMTGLFSGGRDTTATSEIGRNADHVTVGLSFLV